jgi:hypothetical protein
MMSTVRETQASEQHLRGSALPSAINYANAFEACLALRKIKKMRGKFDATCAAPHVVAEKGELRHEKASFAARVV